MKKDSLNGVMGAFILAAQMINFSIPGTGSSGHLGGGMLLAIGVVEGLVTASVVTFVWKARPEIIENAAIGKSLGNK